MNQNYVNSIPSETTSELTQKQSTPSLSIPLILIITILIALIFTCFIVYWTFSKKQIDKSPEKKSLDKINNGSKEEPYFLIKEDLRPARGFPTTI